MGIVYAVGIDFGTSNSCVTYATYYQDMNGRLEASPVHRPEALTFHHRDTIPTVIFLGNESGQPPLYGEMAEEKAVFFPELTRAGFKLRLGKPGASGRDAYLLTKQFLAYLRSRVAEFVPIDQEGVYVQTIVGHPVQWSLDQREETRRAAQEAGFPNVQIEEESLAALYAHLCEERGDFRPEPGSRILMIDMGGGTTDFAFLQIPKGTEQRPISTPVNPAAVVPGWGNGRTSYGGRDLDQLLLEHLGREWDPKWITKHRPMLMREVRRFKETFSSHVREGLDQHETMWLVGDTPCRVALTKDEFESIAGQYVAQFAALVRGALTLANVAPRQVSHLILAGGHSRWYFVDETLKQIFPHVSRDNFTLLRHNHPEQSVARGLAYVPLVRAAGAKMHAPVKKAAHSVWLHVPYGAQISKSAEGNPAKLKERSPGWDEPVLIMTRGQQLPFRMQSPIRIAVNKFDMDAKEATVSIQVFMGAGGNNRIPLYDRVARFERGFWENMMKRFGTRLPWATGVDEDQFELLIQCEIDENELLTGELIIIRYFRGKEMAVQRQQLQVASSAPNAVPSGGVPVPARAGVMSQGRTPTPA
jgi:hypothetical protein